MTPPVLPADLPFGIRPVTFGDALYGLECTSPLAHYTLLLQGAQLLSWTPIDSAQVVWTSPHTQFIAGKSPRGGTPICWPWFGPHPNPSLPAHGLVRGKPWSLDSISRECDGTDVIRFSTQTSADTTPDWPYEAALSLTYRIGESLDLKLETLNQDRHPLRISEAFHTYFKVRDVREISILGLEGTTYMDRLQGDKRDQQKGPVFITTETDRIYLSTPSDCRIIDPLLQREIHISSEGARSRVIWNPWKEKSQRLGDLGTDDYLSMICVEIGNISDDLVELSPHESRSMQVTYRTLNAD